MSSLLLLLAPWLSSYSDSWPPVSFLVHELALHPCFTLEFSIPHGATGAFFPDLPPPESLWSETLLSGLCPGLGSGHSVGLCWPLHKWAVWTNPGGLRAALSPLPCTWMAKSVNPTEYQNFNCDKKKSTLVIFHRYQKHTRRALKDIKANASYQQQTLF